MALFPPTTHWDIFCNVIDNYGDIGVCWRLARQLANEQQQRVRLWVDDLVSFQKICPRINPHLNSQQLLNVTICIWPKCWQEAEVADIVIEAFGCCLPEAYIESMTKVDKTILWLNLEYLTYEEWSIDYHTLPSIQPNGLSKYFFFMGLPETGGLIKEQTLLQEQTDFLTDPVEQQAFLQQLGINKQTDTYLMLVFSYANKNLTSWLNLLAQSQQTYHLLIPPSPLLTNLADYLNIATSQLTVGYTYQKNSLTIQIIPFVTQQDFDKLLWCTAFNLVRGEDSFVRAQYAGSPMLWHIYQQPDNAHLTKLTAFLDHYLVDLPSASQKATYDFWLAWNNQQNLIDSWQNYQKHLPELKKHAKIAAENQKIADDLLTKLANFYKNWLS